MKTLTLDVPDEVYEACEQVAAKYQRSVEEIARQWLAEQAAASQPPLPEKTSRPGRLRFRDFFGAVNSGDPHSGDNDRIDADLAREYANNHEEE